MQPRALARGILDVADAAMMRAIKVISLERGHDPREFTLVAFGGAGGLHACRLARALDISRVLVPQHPGLRSAHGMLHAPRTRHLAQTHIAPLEHLLSRRGAPSWMGCWRGSRRAPRRRAGAGRRRRAPAARRAALPGPELHAAHPRALVHAQDALEDPRAAFEARTRSCMAGSRPGAPSSS